MRIRNTDFYAFQKPKGKKIFKKFKITKFKNKGRIDDPNIIIIRGPEPCFAKAVANKGSQK